MIVITIVFSFSKKSGSASFLSFLQIGTPAPKPIPLRFMAQTKHVAWQWRTKTGSTFNSLWFYLSNDVPCQYDPNYVHRFWCFNNGPSNILLFLSDMQYQSLIGGGVNTPEDSLG